MMTPIRLCGVTTSQKTKYILLTLTYIYIYTHIYIHVQDNQEPTSRGPPMSDLCPCRKNKGSIPNALPLKPMCHLLSSQWEGWWE